tara:strand:+ start:1821 stop:2351 length:531 start_codon:yes stop_codon:yes gene_type:complete
MEKRIIKKTRLYQQEFRNNIKKWVIENSDIHKQKDLLEYIYAYPLLHLTAADFEKRKRVKNSVPLYERCKALRANGEQCTRRKKDNHHFCGTHIKGKPHGVISENDDSNDKNQCDHRNFTRVTIWQEEIQGIIYYIDDKHNVYNTSDILENKISPPVIARWKKNTNGDIIIPSLFD